MNFSRLSVICLFASTFAFGGTREGGGGNSAAARFTATGLELARYISHNQDLFPEINPRAFAETVRKAQVSVTLDTIDPYRNLEARNDPAQQSIVLNLPAYEALGFVRQQVLVLHEHLGLMKLETDTYGISARLYERPMVQSAARGIREKIERNEDFLKERALLAKINADLSHSVASQGLTLEECRLLMKMSESGAESTVLLLQGLYDMGKLEGFSGWFKSEKTEKAIADAAWLGFAPYLNSESICSD